jgi:hypothetical protein
MKVKRENIAVKAKLSEMETDTRKFKNEREKMKESLLDLKCRSMKYNLVFTGLKETPYENTEEKLRGFFGQELGIEHWIEFGNVHRFGQRNPENENMRRKGYPIHRPIVARLISHRDLAYVLEMRKLKGKPFGINQQSPLEVENKWKQLYPVMKKAEDNGHFTRMVRDTLYIVNNLTEGTHEKEVAVEEQLCTPQNPFVSTNQ